MAGPLLHEAGWSAPARAEPAGYSGVVEGTVVDSLSQDPVANASVRIVELGRKRLTDSSGRFRFTQVPPDPFRIEVGHVAYRTLLLRREPGRSDDTTRFVVRLAPRTYLIDAVSADVAPVSPLTSGDRSVYSIHPAVRSQFTVDGSVGPVALLPGVTVSGERPFFRGLGFEQVLPLLDGVPAREPIKGRWIVPPPQAISTADFVSEATADASGPAIAGVIAFRLAEGDDTPQTRIRMRTDRLEVTGDEARRTDDLEVSTSGPTGLRGFYYSGSWQGHATDGHLSYQHAKPEQSILGIAPIGRRMLGSQSSSVKLTLRPPGRSWKLTGSVTQSRERRTQYHDHYARTGWVGFEPAFDRYTTFLDDPSAADSAVAFDGPRHVPVYDWRSTLGLATYSWRAGRELSLRFYGSYGTHRDRAEIPGLDIADNDALSRWLRNDITNTRHQEEWFYATHGDLPEFEDGTSHEGGFGGSGSLRRGDAHDVQFGAGVLGGRHRYAAVSPAGAAIGSLGHGLRVIDGYAYLQDTWNYDRLSSVTLSLRHDFRQVHRSGESSTGSRWAPALRFHQPMTDRDAIHLQGGIAYQFPVLQTYFVADPESQRGIALSAQRTRFFEVGAQHQYSRTVVGYVGAYRREYSDVVFSRRSPSELEAAFGVRELPPQYLDAMGLEAVIDYQPRRGMVGQTSFSWSNTTENDLEAPWSRRLSVKTWLSWQLPRGLLATCASSWDSGRPYEVCLEPRGCTGSQLYKGRLPQPLGIDLALRWGPRMHRPVLHLLAEIRNVLDRRIPTFDFGVYPMRLGSGNFIAFYDEHGETGGYIADLGDAVIEGQVHNPQTRSAGRSVLLGVEIEF